MRIYYYIMKILKFILNETHCISNNNNNNRRFVQHNIFTYIYNMFSLHLDIGISRGYDEVHELINACKKEVL